MHYDTHKTIQFIDIHDTEALKDYPQLSIEKASGKMNVLLPSGAWLDGIDAVHAAYQSVGLSSWVAWTRWPILKPFAKRLYTFIADNRMKISRWLQLR
ncbi:MAG TPA: DUF393 domain-containing protein [Verrucomicrobia bacterium]|nr:DUF393 domain-containing protein [Verrucomicrobiota bacterium]